MTIDAQLVHEAMQAAPVDSNSKALYRQACAAIAEVLRQQQDSCSISVRRTVVGLVAMNKRTGLIVAHKLDGAWLPGRYWPAGFVRPEPLDPLLAELLDLLPESL